MSENYQISDAGSDGWELTKTTGNHVVILVGGMDYDDAADVLRELRTLAADNARLREILKPFACMADALDSMGGTTPRSGEWHSVHSRAGSVAITIEDLRAARDALK